MELSDQINQVENLVTLLRRFENGVLILRTIQGAEGRLRDLESAAAVAQSHVEARHKEIETLDAQIRANVDRYKKSARDLDSREEKIRDAEKRIVDLEAEITEDIKVRAEDVRKGLDQVVGEYRVRAAEQMQAISTEVDALQAKRDGLLSELEAIRERLEG